MNVKELRDLLEWWDDEEEIFIGQPTHNYWGEFTFKPIAEIEFSAAHYDEYEGWKMVPEDYVGNENAYEGQEKKLVIFGGN